MQNYEPPSNMGMLELLKRMERRDITVHGFRSTFKDWASERTNYPREVTEMALAHSIGDKVGSRLPARRSIREAAQADGGMGKTRRKPEASKKSDCIARPQETADRTLTHSGFVGRYNLARISH